jgi:hypothetical protein
VKNSLYNPLINIIYVGKVECGGQVYEGEHHRIIADEIWNRVQSALDRNGRHGGRNIGNKYSALLKGLVRCASCDVGMIHTYVILLGMLDGPFVIARGDYGDYPNWNSWRPARFFNGCRYQASGGLRTRASARQKCKIVLTLLIQSHALLERPDPGGISHPRVHRINGQTERVPFVHVR